MKFFIALSYMFCVLSICQGQSTIQINHYFQGTKTIRESFSVKAKNQAIKSGDYKLYSKNGTILISGQYENNYKTGEWSTYHDDGSLKTKAIYDQGTMIQETKHGLWITTEENGKVRKVIDYSVGPNPQYFFDIPIRYPALARKNGIEGTVNIELTSDDQCNIKQWVVKDSLGYGCEKEAISALKELIKYTKKYQEDSCKNITKTYPFRFSLLK
jgi:hypothetical protein